VTNEYYKITPLSLEQTARVSKARVTFTGYTQIGGELEKR